MCIGVVLPNFHKERQWPVEMLKLITLVTVLVKTGVVSLRSLANTQSRPVAICSFRFAISFITFFSVISGMLNLSDGSILDFAKLLKLL